VSYRLQMYEAEESLATLQRLDQNPDAFAAEVRTHYFGHAATPPAEQTTAAFELIEACVHGGLTHENWLARHSRDVATPQLDSVRLLKVDVRSVRDEVFQSDAYGDAIRRMHPTLAHLSDGHRRRTLWIRWLQQREDAVLGDLEDELHRVRRRRMPWFDNSLEAECDDSDTPLLERLAPYRPLYPVAFVRGALLVEDARCEEEPLGTPEHERQAQAARAGREHYHLKGQGSTPSPSSDDLGGDNEEDNEGSTRAERQQANARAFERRVVLGTNVPLSTLASCERWEGTRVVATPLEPSSSLPTLDCARTIVRQRPESPDPLADQFGTDGAADAMDTTA